jgi:hypothetical protein
MKMLVSERVEVTRVAARGMVGDEWTEFSRSAPGSSFSHKVQHFRAYLYLPSHVSS